MDPARVPAGEELPIGQVASRSGQTVVRLRHWERVGLLDPPVRRGGKRRYPPAVLERIAVIDLARRAGFSLAEVRELLAAVGRHHAQPPGVRWRELVGRKQAELDELLGAVRAMQALLARLAACDCVSLEECGARAAAGGVIAGDTRPRVATRMLVGHHQVVTAESRIPDADLAATLDEPPGKTALPP